MKKLLLAGAAIALSMSLFACAPKGDGSAIAPPIQEYKSLDQINEIAQTNILHPGVMGIADESFSIIDDGQTKIAEYTFRINDLYATIRSANTLEDISGLRVNEKSIFSKEPQNDVEYKTLNDVKAARWFNTNGQYVFTITDELNEVSEEQFKNMVNEIKSETEPSQDVSHLAGDYQDETSQRASMNIECKDNVATITVTWASGADETTQWTMHAKIGEDGLLAYNDCTKQTNGVVEYKDGSGYFQIVDGKLQWDGASEENCQTCVFTKIA